MSGPAPDYTLDFKNTDFRQYPDLYRIGKGGQGVLLIEPYKGEILPHWRFKTVAEAKKSSATICKMFLAYLKAEDFPGADMARKVLQMGWTRAKRYTNHKGGRKYDKKTGEELPRTEDAEKSAAVAVFYEQYVAARQHPEYVRLKKEHRAKMGVPSKQPTVSPQPHTHLAFEGFQYAREHGMGNDYNHRDLEAFFVDSQDIGVLTRLAGARWRWPKRRAVEPFEYERVCGAFWDTVIERDGKAAIARSAERYRRAIRGDAQ